MTTDDRTDAHAASIETRRALAQQLAHDMRNPLAALAANVGFLEAMLAQHDGAADALGDVHLALGLLSRMVDNVALLAKLEPDEVPAAPTEPFDDERCDAVARLRASVERVAPAFQAKRLEARVTVAPDVTPMRYTRADPLLLDALFEGLLWNAAQHAPAASTVRITLDAPAPALRLVLEDAGCAFTAGARSFTREAQLTLKRDGHGRYGRGLGLYVVGLVAARIGATIEARSQGPHGHVTVTLRSADRA